MILQGCHCAVQHAASQNGVSKQECPGFLLVTQLGFTEGKNSVRILLVLIRPHVRVKMLLLSWISKSNDASS